MRRSQKTGVCGLCLLAVAAVTLSASPAMATVNWVGTGNWFDAANWGGTLPNATTQTGNIRSGTVSILSGDSAVALNMYFSSGAGSSDSTLNMSGGTLTGTGQNLWYGQSSGTGSAMIWNMSGGAATFGDEMVLMNNAQFNPDSVTASATLNMTGGSLLFGGDIMFGDDSAGVIPTSREAHIQLDGGTLSAAAITTGLGSGGTPSFDMTGGTLILDGEVTSMPSFATANGGAGSFVFNYDSFADKTTITIPEPSSMVLMGLGLIGLVGYVWRKRR